MKMFKGHVAHLVRHPCGAAVIDDVYHVANAKQRTAMVAELYGREFVLFSGEAKRITDIFDVLPPPKQKAVIRNMSQHAIPIMEKALVDSPLVHRYDSDSGCLPCWLPIPACKAEAAGLAPCNMLTILWYMAVWGYICKTLP